MIVECIESANSASDQDNNTVDSDLTSDSNSTNEKAKRDKSYQRNDFISRNREVKNKKDNIILK